MVMEGIYIYLQKVLCLPSPSLQQQLISEVEIVQHVFEQLSELDVLPIIKNIDL